MPGPLVRDVVVIGACADGTQDVVALLLSLPRELPVSVFVVQHLEEGARGELVAELRARGATPRADLARDGESVERGRIYLAPHGQHLLLEADQLVVGHGPKLHGFCPSADLTYMSAATTYGERVIAVAMPGLLGEASAGLQVVHDRGGRVIIGSTSPEQRSEWPGLAVGSPDVDWVEPSRIPATLERWIEAPRR